MTLRHYFPVLILFAFGLVVAFFPVFFGLLLASGLFGFSLLLGFMIYRYDQFSKGLAKRASSWEQSFYAHGRPGFRSVVVTVGQAFPQDRSSEV